MTFSEINFEEQKVCSETIYYGNYKNFDHNGFAIDATYNIPWANIYNIQDLNHKVELLNTYITTLLTMLLYAHLSRNIRTAHILHTISDK